MVLLSNTQISDQGKMLARKRIQLCATLEKAPGSLANIRQVKGLFTNKSNFTLGLQVYNTNSIFFYMKMNQLIAKSLSEIRRVNKFQDSVKIQPSVWRQFYKSACRVEHLNGSSVKPPKHQTRLECLQGQTLKILCFTRVGSILTFKYQNRIALFEREKYSV